MIIDVNKIGTYSIDVDLIKNIITDLLEKQIGNKITNIDIKKTDDDKFYFYITYSPNEDKRIIIDTSALANLLAKTITNNFGIEYPVLVFKIGH